ncbi:MAG: ABC-2 type transport system permease protein [Patiriisocius sp.]|jgi:ABC-2 type transport system permease protein
MLLIIKNEWRFLIRSRIFLGITIAFVLILLGSIILGNYQTQMQKQNHSDATEHVRQKWESIDSMNPHSAAHYGTYIFKPANLLNNLDEGVNSITGNVLRIEGHVQNETMLSDASQIQSVSRFGKLKSSLLLQYMVPLLLVFLAFNVMSSEKQSGRLKLLVLQGTKPLRIIASKTISVWLYGVLLLSLVVIIYTILNFRTMDGEILMRTALFFLSYTLYYFIITGLTVFFSARWQNATVALTSMLGIWILWTIFLPNILMTSVEKWHPLPSRNDFKTAMNEDRSKGIDGHDEEDARSIELENRTLEEYGVDSLHQLPINFAGIRMQADEDFGNSVWDKHFGKNREILEQQKQSFQLGGILNPFISLQNTSMGFMASDNLHHQEFLLEVENYRRLFIKMLNDDFAYGGSKTGDWDYEANGDFFKSVPHFDYQTIRISSYLHHYFIDLSMLLAWSVAVFMLILLGTKKIRLV